MPSPFPGMDPYLEGPLWGSFHAQFCSEVARHLTPRLGSKYIALVEERLVMETAGDVAIATRSAQPDVSVLARRGKSASGSAALLEAPLHVEIPISSEVRQHFVEIRSIDGMELITVVEALSPANKRGDGRREYLQKRDAILRSEVNLIEIDLLRAGQRLPASVPLPELPYFVFLHRTSRRPLADVWPIGFLEPLPVVPVPLCGADPDILLELGTVFTGAYDSAGYGRAIAYRTAPPSGWTPEEEAQAAQILRET